MTSSFIQIAGESHSQSISNNDGTTSNVLVYGNSSAPTIYQPLVSGSRNVLSQLTFSISYPTSSTTVATIQVDKSSTSNWWCDITLFANSNSNSYLIGWIVSKPTNNTTSWNIFTKPMFQPSTNQYLIPANIYADTTNNRINFIQNPGLTSDGNIYYLLQYSFTSGNNPNISFPYILNIS